MRCTLGLLSYCNDVQSWTMNHANITDSEANPHSHHVNGGLNRSLERVRTKANVYITRTGVWTVPLEYARSELCDLVRRVCSQWVRSIGWYDVTMESDRARDLLLRHWLHDVTGSTSSGQFGSFAVNESWRDLHTTVRLVNVKMSMEHFAQVIDVQWARRLCRLQSYCL